MWPFRPKPAAASLWVQGEDLAAKHLVRQGLKILARNVKCGRNEIDIIARDGDTIVFVEVRTRQSPEPVLPEDSVNAVKQARVRAGANWYIARHPGPETYYRFDVIGVILPEGGPPQIAHYRNAF